MSNPSRPCVANGILTVSSELFPSILASCGRQICYSFFSCWYFVVLYPLVMFYFCYRCSECKRALSSTYYARGNTLYCKKDYTAKFQSTCHACEHNITGPVMVCVIERERTILTKPVNAFGDKVFILDICVKFIPLN